MEIGILGPLTIRRGDTPVVVRAPKPRAVLLRLVLDVGQVVSTDRLLEDVWAGQPPRQGLVTLRSYISNLRDALGDRDGDAVLVSHAQGYMLALDPGSVDATRFERLVERGRAHLAAGEIAPALEQLEAGLNLWRGHPLPEVADEHFAKPHVVRYEELRLGAEEQRFECLLLTGRHAEALPALEAFVARHPLREQAWAHLVLALYRAGRAPEALESHRSFRELLADELGMDPSPAFRRLAELILQQSAELDIAGPTPVRIRPPTITTHTRLVGRDAERERLVTMLGHAFEGRGCLAFVSGPPGIGKTALLQDFAATAAPLGAQIHWGRCPEVPGAPAFWPWTQVIRSIADVSGDEQMGGWLAGVAAGAMQLVPDLADRAALPPVPVVDDPSLARFRLFEAVAAFLRRVAESATLVVALEDLHWADDSSLDLLAFLAPQLADLPLVIAATMRDLAMDQRVDLRPLLASVARTEGADHIELRGLSEREVADLIADAFETPPSPDRVRELYERSDGNPFFVRQLGRLLRAADVDTLRPVGELPAGIRHVLERRLDRLPLDTRRQLEAAAVIGRDFDLRHVATMSALALDDVADLIDVAVEYGLVERAGPAATAQRFVHALVREVLYDRLAPGRAAHLHAAAAEALKRDRSATSHTLAEHYWQAAELFSDDRPVRAMLAAARASLDVLAYEQAEQLVVRAIELTERHPGPPAALELEVRLQHLALANGALRWTDPAAVAEVAAIQDLGRDGGIGAALAPLWWRARTFVSIRGDHAAAVALCRALVEDTKDEDATLQQAAGHVGAAFSLSCLGDAPAAQAELARATPHLDASPPGRLASFDLDLNVVALVTEAITRAQLGEVDASTAAGDEAVAVAARQGRPFVQAYAHLLAAVVAALQEQPDRAQAQADAARRLCEEHGFTMLARLARPLHGWSLARLSGDATGQVEGIVDAVGWITAVGHRHLLPLLLGLLAEVYQLADQPSLSRRHLEEARAAMAATGERFAEATLARLSAADAGS